MKKNVIIFIIDSLNNTRIRQYGDVLMPYFTSLKHKYCFADQMYSEAPYTEAALMNLYCGQDVLQDNGYLFRFRDAKSTFFEEMQKEGYTTYFNAYQPQCYPSSLRRGVDYIYYNVGFDIDAFWSYRIYHYSELYNNNCLKEYDYVNLKELLEDNFKEWLIFLDALLTNDESIGMIKGNAGDYDPCMVKVYVKEQYDLFNQDNISYINNLLKKGYNHPLFKIRSYSQCTKIKNRSSVENIRKVLKPLYRKIKWINFKRNFSSIPTLCKTISGTVIRYLSKEVERKDLLKTGFYSLNHLFDFDLYGRINSDFDSFKNAPSARTHIDHFMNWAKVHSTEKPFFACIHVDDVHNPEVFFTYDTDRMDIIEEEAALANRTLESLPRGSRGSVTHDLSLSYIDNIIKYLVESVKAQKFGDNTSILICADHGFSFSGDPFRESYVTNLYLENYNMPFLIIDDSLMNIEIKGLRSSKDIPRFIKDMSVDSKQAYNNLPEHKVCIIEYCGGGCPDLTRRKLKIAAFDKEFFVGTLCDVYKELTDNEITEIYNLKDDLAQSINLRSKNYDKSKIIHLINVIKERRKEIRNSMNDSNSINY